MLCALTATGFRNWLFQDPPSTSQRGTHWYAGSRTKRAPSQEPLCTNLQYRTNSLFVIAGEENTLAQKWEASIEVACFFFFFQPGDTDGEVFSTPPQPAAHPRLPYVFAKALSQCHWLSIQSIEPQCLLFISCLEGLTGYTDKTLIKTSSVTSCDLKAARVLEPSVTSWRSPCLWDVCAGDHR